MFKPAFHNDPQGVIDHAPEFGRKLLVARQVVLQVKPDDEHEMWFAKRQYDEAYHVLFLAVAFFQPGRFDMLEDMMDAGIIDFGTFVQMAVESVSRPSSAGPVDLPSF